MCDARKIFLNNRKSIIVFIEVRVIFLQSSKYSIKRVLKISWPENDKLVPFEIIFNPRQNPKMAIISVSFVVYLIRIAIRAEPTLNHYTLAKDCHGHGHKHYFGFVPKIGFQQFPKKNSA